MTLKNPLLPKPAVIKDIKVETPDIRTFTLSFLKAEDRDGFSFTPGQFVILSILGIGESAISLSSNFRLSKEFFEVSVRRVGNVTGKLFEKKQGEVVGVRGPFGVGWPMEEAKGTWRRVNLLIIGGGCGVAALRSVILEIAENRGLYGRVEVLYGARTPGDLLYTYEYDHWRSACRLLLTVDAVPPSVEWKHRIGVVTTLFEDISIKPENSLAFICGPEVMARFVIRGLLARGFQEDKIFLSMERRMRCGIGKCGHCQIGGKYTCIHGPVFSYSDLKGESDAVL